MDYLVLFVEKVIIFYLNCFYITIFNKLNEINIYKSSNTFIFNYIFQIYYK